MARGAWATDASGVLIARVRRTLRERALLAGGERVLVAISGGPDSAALLHVLLRLAPELSLTLAAASVDHRLRPGSARDVEVAAGLAARLEVPFAALAVDVAPGGSLQAAARDARYAALRAHAETLGASRVAVGHTLDDQAETVLARLLRGAPLAGLGAIAPRRADGVVRPLLDCRRDEVRAHVARFALPHVADPSNDDPRFGRVRVRHELLPVLAGEDPRVAVHLARLADEARDVADWVAAELRSLGPLLVAGPLPRAEVLAHPRPVAHAAIARWVEARSGQAPKGAHVEAIAALRDGGEVLIGGEWVVRIEGGAWCARREPDHPTRSGSSHAANTE